MEMNAIDESVTTENAVVKNRLSFLPKILRTLGAVTLLGSVSIFMFQGWESGNDISRYLLLLAHTVGLAIIGLMSGRYIKESKGARLLVALALASIPAAFAIMGGFAYSQFAIDGLSVFYPGYASWRVDSPLSAIVTIGASIAVLLPVIWLGFMVLSRKAAGRFTLVYLLTNAAMLIPIRDTSFVGWLVLGLVALVVISNSRAKSGDSSLKTREGLLARGLQFLPLAVILGRGMSLYAGDIFLATVTYALVYVVVRQLSLIFADEPGKQVWLERIALLPAYAVSVGVTNIVQQTFSLSDPFAIPVFVITLAALTMEIALRSNQSAATYRRLATATVTIGMLANLMLFGGVIMAAVCLALGLAVLVYGYMVEQRLVFLLGVVTLLTGISFQVSYAVTFFDLGSWASLAALGIAAILSGSVIEKHGDRLKTSIKDWGRQFRSWDY
jgi:hypothetical protein